jgi:hypothetical protein
MRIPKSHAPISELGLATEIGNAVIRELSQIPLWQHNELIVYRMLFCEKISDIYTFHIELKEQKQWGSCVHFVAEYEAWRGDCAFIAYVWSLGSAARTPTLAMSDLQGQRILFNDAHAIVVKEREERMAAAKARYDVIIAEVGEDGYHNYISQEWAKFEDLLKGIEEDDL